MGRFRIKMRWLLCALLSVHLNALAQTEAVEEANGEEVDQEVVSLEQDLSKVQSESLAKDVAPKAWSVGDGTHESKGSVKEALGEDSSSAATITLKESEAFVPSNQAQPLDTELGSAFVATENKEDVFVKILKPDSEGNETATEKPAAKAQAPKEFKIVLVKENPTHERTKSRNHSRKPASAAN